MSNKTPVYWSKGYIIKNSYDDISVTVTIELPKGRLKDYGHKMVLEVLKCDIENLLNDEDFDRILKLKETKE